MRAEPDRPERHLALGRAYARAGRTDLAVTTLSQAASRFPTESSVYTALASVWLGQAVAQGDRIALQKGVEALRQAGPAGASDSTLLTLMGAAWLRVREPRRALRSFEQATAVLPLDPDGARPPRRHRRTPRHVDRRPRRAPSGARPGQRPGRRRPRRAPA